MPYKKHLHRCHRQLWSPSNTFSVDLVLKNYWADRAWPQIWGLLTDYAKLHFSQRNQQRFQAKWLEVENMESKELLYQAKAGGPGENGACFPPFNADFLTTSFHLEMITEASKIQMRNRLVKESHLFLWHILLAWRQNLLLHLDSWENGLHLLLQDLKMCPSEAKKETFSFLQWKIRHHRLTVSMTATRKRDHASNQDTKSATKQWLKNQGIMLKTITHKTNLWPFPAEHKELFHIPIILT